MRCPDCRMTLFLGWCDRCKRSIAGGTAPASGLIDTHQVDESGSADLQVRVTELEGEVARLGQLLVESHDREEHVISGERCSCGDCAPYRALAAETEQAADPRADGTD